MTHDGHGARTWDELVVCSLEPWDDVWRRNQFLVRELLALVPGLRVLFVEPPADLALAVLGRHSLAGRGLRQVGERHWVLRPLKLAPRSLGPFADRSLVRQVVGAAAGLGFERPVLWVNDSVYAALLGRVAWPVLYDVTDDWLAASAPPRELSRRRTREADLLRESAAVVVCSPGLAATRGASRDVVVVPNGVDVDHFRAPVARPHDLPASPVAVYVGTLHEDRLDVALCLELAEQLPHVRLALVGPSSLGKGSLRLLRDRPNVHLLGPRPYADVPGYLQHADVLVVPHVATPFTESLDPIKAYECLAVGTPTVATAVAGFRELAGRVDVVAREGFVAAAATALVRPPPAGPGHELPSWRARAERFAEVLDGVAGGPREGASDRPGLG